VLVERDVTDVLKITMVSQGMAANRATVTPMDLVICSVICLLELVLAWQTSVANVVINVKKINTTWRLVA